MIETNTRVRLDLHGRGSKRQYRTVKRCPRYIHRLTARSFCLDIFVLSRQGFFRVGRYLEWIYYCETEKEGFRGEARIMWVNSPSHAAHAIQVACNVLCESTIIMVIFRPHPIFRWVNWFQCPKCRRLTATLFVPLGASYLACRRCHKLYYLSQVRGCRRLGTEKYREQQRLYKMKKNLTRSSDG